MTPDAGDLALLVLLGVLGGFGQLFMTNGYRFAQASTLASFDYVAMIWAILLRLAVLRRVAGGRCLCRRGHRHRVGSLHRWRERKLGLAHDQGAGREAGRDAGLELAAEQGLAVAVA